MSARYTLTSAEVAEQAGVAQATVRRWVARGKLTPLRRGARPLRFDAAEVGELLHDRLDTLWSQVLASERHDAAR